MDDDLGPLDLLDGDDEPDNDTPPGDVFVCDVITDGELCGDNFDTQGKLNQHRWQKHRLKKEVETKRARRRGGSSRPRKPQAPPVVNTDRAATYTSGIAMAGLGLYLAPGPFNTADLNVVSAGAPKLGGALANLAEQNAAVRQACDLILGGGAGGAYIELVMACLAIAVPIAANHGVMPEDVGVRFGAMIGVVPAPTPEPPTVAEPPPTPEPTFADFMEPDSPTGDLDDKVMRGPNAVRVSVDEQLDDGRDEPGPEQPAPAEQEPLARVPA